MGHLLGATPAHPEASAVSDPPFRIVEVEVDTLRLADRPPSGIAAFAIDSPRIGDETYGAGVEINGWVIGRGAPVQGVRTTTGDHRGKLQALTIRRPDVAAAYSTFDHACASGFSTWASIDPGAAEWRIAIEAVLANGTTETLAEFAGKVSTLRRQPGRDAVPVAAPSFVIIGAQRGGTTSLHAYLSAHPQVRTPETKEFHFVTDRHERGLDWYLGQFPFALPPGMLTGEATPYALFHPLAPARLRQIAPRAKLIALLRNPSNRAYSHYLLERSRGDEPLEFAAALEAESERLAGEEARLMRDPAYVSEPHKHASYLARGNYAPQLERWLTVYPRESLLVLRSEDLFHVPAETFARVAEFLGITPDVDISFTAHNRTEGPPLDARIRRRLEEHFAPRNARLRALLGWDPGWG
jgi:hypothetical protein